MTTITQPTRIRYEIPMGQLVTVYEAAKLLRRHGLISVEEIRDIRQYVHADCNTHMERSGYDPACVLSLGDVYEATKPL